jgi:hypothetical protein
LTREEATGPALLTAISDETGGRIFSVEHPDESHGVATQIGFALRNQYLLGYSPAKNGMGNIIASW